MNTSTPAATHTGRELLGEIRDRLQCAHFVARGVPLRNPDETPQPLADQLHAIRVLAEELDDVLAHEHVVE